ncbi:hypothetical protein ACH4C6_04840 [Streptomyces sp. NPDC017943]|uniref:hypothetical protein n=1 Tax=Streptomyces sp. NPDC017943 TaxID=3365019 RepID=UPI00378EBEFF
MQGTTVRRTGLGLAVATALTGLLGACTSPAPSDGSGERGPEGRYLTALRSAERATERAGSARVESTTAMGSLMSMRADGALGWDGGMTGTLTITYTGGTVADTMRRLGSASIQARYLPDAYYARMSEKFAERTGGKRWIRYAYEDLEALTGGSGAHFGDQMRGTTPDQSVKLLLASRDVRKVGRETVRGRAATHWSGTVDADDVTDAGLRGQLTDAGVTSETLDVWVDGRDLLVKKVEKARTATGVTTQTAYYTDYGVPVRAQRPPRADTGDFEDLLRERPPSTP